MREMESSPIATIRYTAGIFIRVTVDGPFKSYRSVYACSVPSGSTAAIQSAMAVGMPRHTRAGMNPMLDVSDDANVITALLTAGRASCGSPPRFTPRRVGVPVLAPDIVVAVNGGGTATQPGP